MTAVLPDSAAVIRLCGPKTVAARYLLFCEKRLLFGEGGRTGRHYLTTAGGISQLPLPVVCYKGAGNARISRTYFEGIIPPF